MPSTDESAELLRRALMYDDVDAVTALLEIGVDPNTMYNDTHTSALMLVQSAAAARALLAAGADPSVVNDDGWTALGNAVHLPPDVTEVLLKAGAQATQPLDTDGHTAFLDAACYGNAGSVKLLLAAARPGDIAAALDCARTRRSLDADSPFPKRAYVDYGAVIALLERAAQPRR